MRFRRLSLGAFAIVLMGGAPAGAATALDRPLKAHIKRFKMPSKVVETRVTGKGRKKIKRVFIPITPQTEQDFLATFSAGRGALVIRPYVGRDIEHPYVMFSDRLGYGHDALKFNPRTQAGSSNTGTLWEGFVPSRQNSIVFTLSKKQIQYLQRRWLEPALLKGVQPEGCDKSGCMWWLVHAKTGPRQQLAHVLGVRRSAASSNLQKKLIHAGNDHVPIIGVHVDSFADFRRMNVAELMGPPPGGGVSEAVKR